MKKLLALVLALAMLISAATVLVSADDEDEIVNREVKIYEADKAPTLDGKIEDDEYKLISEWPLDDDVIVSRGDYAKNIKAYFYMCYDADNLYYAVKTECEEPHIAVMDNNNKRYVFNAHYLMTLIIPDDPTRVNEETGKNIYPGQEAGWSDLANGGYAYEWSTIFPSETVGSTTEGVPFATDHFLNMVSQMQFCTGHADGYDYYEMSIPWSALKNKYNPDGVKVEKGSVFGFDCTVGLTNVSDDPDVIANGGYDGIDQGDGTTIYKGNYLYFADAYNHGAKDLKHACIVELAGDVTGTDEPGDDPVEEDKNIAKGKTYTVSGNELRGDNYDDNETRKLTDGIVGISGSAADLCGFIADDNGAVTVVVDLGEVKSLGELKTYAVNFGSWGIPTPTKVTFAVSKDGTTFGDEIEAGEPEVLAGTGVGEGWEFPTYSVKGSYEGRYIKVVYYRDGKGHVWVSEIEAYAGEASEEKLGDFDGDGSVTSDDAVYLLRHTLFAEQYPISGFADFDHDDSITSDDAVYLLRHTLFSEQYPLSK